MKTIRLFLVYFVFAFLGVFGPPLAKLALTGAAGVNADLFATMVFAPASLLLLGAFLGRRVFVLHVACYWVFSSIAFFVWMGSNINLWKDLASAQQVNLLLAFFAAYLANCLGLTRSANERFFSGARELPQRNPSP